MEYLDMLRFQHLAVDLRLKNLEVVIECTVVTKTEPTPTSILYGLYIGFRLRGLPSLLKMYFFSFWSNSAILVFRKKNQNTFGMWVVTNSILT